MKDHKIIFLLNGFFLFLLFFCFTGAVFAQEGYGIKISPVRIDEVVEPGQVLKMKLKVTNEGDQGRELFAYLKDFKAEGETGKPLLIAPGSEEGYYLASWIDITAEPVKFGPDEEKEIEFLINVPPEAGPGGYYGAVYFGNQPASVQIKSEDKGAGMAIAQQAGALILLQVKGDVDERALIREFNTDKKLYGIPFDVDFIIRIENQGNVHVKPYGAVSITNMFGKKVGVVRVNEKQGNILPKSIRRFEEKWQGKMGFGRYTASIGLTYGTPPDLGGKGKQTLYTAQTFWIIPWRLIVPTLLVFLIIVLIIALFLKFYKNKAIRKAMQQAGFGNVRYVKKYQGPSPFLHFILVLTVVFIIIFLLVTAGYFLLFA